MGWLPPKILENPGYKVSELVVGSGEQDKAQVCKI